MTMDHAFRFVHPEHDSAAGLAGMRLAASGQVEIVDRVIDAGSGTFGVRLDLPNEAYAIPSGTNCLVRFLAAK